MQGLQYQLSDKVYCIPTQVGRYILCGTIVCNLHTKYLFGFFLTALLQTPQGNLVGPRFIETSPLSNRIRHPYRDCILVIFILFSTFFTFLTWPPLLLCRSYRGFNESIAMSFKYTYFFVSVMKFPQLIWCLYSLCCSKTMSFGVRRIIRVKTKSEKTPDYPWRHNHKVPCIHHAVSVYHSFGSSITYFT